MKLIRPLMILGFILRLVLCPANPCSSTLAGGASQSQTGLSIPLHTTNEGGGTASLQNQLDQVGEVIYE